MKKILLVLVALVVLPVFTHAQNDTLYLMKHGVPIHKVSIRQPDVDSIIFYRPAPRTIEGPIDIAYVSIPAGTFTMGSPVTEPSRESIEYEHRVTLSAFKMSKCEITNAQYAEFLNNNQVGSDGIYTFGQYPLEILINRSPKKSNWGLNYIDNKWIPVPGYENHPVICVSWYGANEFANYVNGSLPTEAQWEYACRAGTSTPFSSGYFLTNLDANYVWASPYNGGTNTISTGLGYTQPVGTYPPNAWGLYDMHGNVAEWCYDWFSDYTTAAQTNPTGPAYGSDLSNLRVVRGGAFNYGASLCRSAFRDSQFGPGYNRYTGFRVVIVQ